MLLALVLSSAANFYWEKAIGPVSESQGFTGFFCHHKALEWARSHPDKLTSAEQAATHRAVTGYRYNCYFVGVVITLAGVNASLILAG